MKKGKTNTEQISDVNTRMMNFSHYNEYVRPSQNLNTDFPEQSLTQQTSKTPFACLATVSCSKIQTDKESSVPLQSQLSAHLAENVDTADTIASNEQLHYQKASFENIKKFHKAIKYRIYQ